MTSITCVLLLTTLLSGASAARPRRGNVLAPGPPVNHDTRTQNVGFHAEAQVTSVLTAPRGLTTLTPSCSKAFDILNNDKGYLAAVDAVFDDARAVGKAVGEKCYAAMKPSLAPLGGKCTASAQPFWTPERRADVVTLSKASAAALPPSQAAPILWLDEVIVTGSPFPFIPIIKVGRTFRNILPVYVPSSCRSDADVAGVLALLSAGCVEEQPFLSSCAFFKSPSASTSTSTSTLTSTSTSASE